MVHFDATVALIYQAASGHAPWEQAMEHIAESLGLLLAQVIGVDFEDRRVLFSFEGGSGNAAATLDYTRTYHRLDPHAECAARLAVGEYASFSELVGDEVAQTHPFYQDYLIPYGGRHVHGAKLYECHGRLVILGLHRGVGTLPLLGREIDLASKLVFHLVHAFAVYMHSGPTFAEAAFGQSLLDRLASPVLMLDAQRRIVLRNAQAASLLARCDALQVDAHGILRCRWAREDVEIGLAIKALQISGHPGLVQGPPAERRVLAIPVRGMARPLVLTFLAIRPETTLMAFGSRALAMVVLQDTNQPNRVDPLVLVAAFDFTPAEARVASQLAGGLSPAEIAAMNKTSKTTTNTHIRAVHEKMGVGRTSEAVAILHSLTLASAPSAESLPEPLRSRRSGSRSSGSAPALGSEECKKA